MPPNRQHYNGLKLFTILERSDANLLNNKLEEISFFYVFLFDFICMVHNNSSFLLAMFYLLISFITILQLYFLT